MPLPYQAIPQLVQNGLVAVQANADGGDGANGIVSWSLQGHWYLNQAGYAAIFSQITSYFATRAAFPPSQNSRVVCEVNDFQGRYSVDNQDLQVQATAIFNILVQTTTNVSGGY